MRPLLINKVDICDFKKISGAVPLKKIDQFIRDAQEHDLCPLLGFNFYHTILNSYQDQIYQDLIHGSDYTIDGIKFKHGGLKSVLVEFTWGRYVYEGTYSDSPFGYVQKRTHESDPVSDVGRRDIWKMSKQKANNYFEGVKHFLDNSSDYPLWKSDSCDNNHSKSTLRINKIS